jgi:hydrazine synthase alpha subunit-like protein/WD40 repeat protein
MNGPSPSPIFLVMPLLLVPFSTVPFSTVRGDAPTLATLLHDEPADSLIGLLEPGPGFSVRVQRETDARPVEGWQTAKAGPQGRTFEDPATGLLVTRTHRWLEDPGFVLIDTTLSNGGSSEVTVEDVSIADWTFRVAADADSLRHAKLTYRSDIWYESTYWTGPNWTRVGKDWHHPGENTPAVRRFTCPRDGRITISGRVYKLDTKPSDGVRLSIRHRGQDVWQAEIDGTDDQGIEPSVTLDVRRGDAVRFVVNKRVAISCDTTHWDPVITYDDGPSFQASKAFSAKKQGDGGWSYEMLVDEQTQLGLPELHTFDRRLILGRHALKPGLAVRLSHADSLPLAVISDGQDESGIALVVVGPNPWRLKSSLNSDGQLRLVLSTGEENRATVLSPGDSVQLPRIVLAPYRKSWIAGLSKIQRLLDSEKHSPEVTEFSTQLSTAFARHLEVFRSSDQLPDVPELDYWAMIQDDWRQDDKLDETPEAYAAATHRHIQQARRLLVDIRGRPDNPLLAARAKQLEWIEYEAEANDLSPHARRDLYHRTRWLKRSIALANPLVDFGELLFVKRVPTSYSHLVMQYYGWRARRGGGIFILEEPGRSLRCRDILDGQLSSGNVLEPRLSYDAKRIVFSFVDHSGKQFDAAGILNDTDEGFYHIWEVNVDGSGLRQITSGPYDDLMPTYLPDGRIVFSSTRRRGYARCFGGQFSRRWHVYTLHRVDSDGSNLRTLSFHDTNEWFPTVSNRGHVLYARWDYIDRDAVTHQNLWSTRPDGTNPVAVWGNATSSPHCTFQLQPIPGSGKVVFAASAHHSIAGGSIAIVDPTVADNGQQAITRITPEIPFPEAESRDIKEYYTAPWPLSEKHFLVGYSPTPLVWEPGANGENALGIYLLDVFGNRELIYRDPHIGSTNPCPLAARPMPPVIPSTLPDDAPPVGEMVLADVYQGLGKVPRGTIKSLRIVQIFPKSTNVANAPPIGMAKEENGRAILGTVPVEPDGSARFLVPAGKPLLFQALDQDGLAYQTMRTVTYVQPGERVSCVGCHENRMSAPTKPVTELAALGRPPSKIDPGRLGGRPFSFVEVVQPILDKHCIQCHGTEDPDGAVDLTATPHAEFTKSYVSLTGDVDFWSNGTNPENAARALVPRFGGRNQIHVTPPGGIYGARGSRLMRLLREGHEDVVISADEFRSLGAWIDSNAIFYGVNLPENQARQLRGEIVEMPDIQ